MQPSPLKIAIEIDPARTRRWMVRLARRLKHAGHAVALAPRDGAGAPPPLVELLIALERLVHGRPGEHAADRVSRDALAGEAAGPDDATDLVIDLTGGEPRRVGRRLSLAYDGDPREEAAVAAVIEGRAPRLGIVASDMPGRPWTVRPAVEHPHVLAFALDQLGTRAGSLLFKAVERLARGEPLDAGDPVIGAAPRARIGLAALAWKLSTRLTALARRAPHWYVGWRRCGPLERLGETGVIPPEGWRRVPDDGLRFYADPLVFAHEGRHVLFVEELSHRLGKGIIAYLPFGPDGPEGPARPVLEAAHHLSYPFVFRHDGAIYLIPESVGPKRVELYRAVEFPHRWALEAVLLDDVAASDATIIAEGGRLYLFATVAGEDASSWDALHVWSADALTGPWRPLPDNPVVLDALGARPAGAFYRRNGALYRPAQDCRAGYGAGLALARVDRLDPGGFAQTIERIIYPEGAWPGTSLHTLNYADGIEVVDGCAPR